MAEIQGDTNWTAIASALSALVSGTSVWFVGRGKLKAEIKKIHAEIEKSKAEATTAQLQNVEKAIAIWQKTAEDSQKHLQHEINNLRVQINGLYAKIRDQDRVISCYATELIRLGADPQKLLQADDEDQPSTPQ